MQSKKIKNYESARDVQNQPQTLIYPKKTDQAHLVLGLRTFSRHDKNMPILRVINNILGDTMSSRLFTEVRERRGLAYYVSSDFNDFDDTGYLAACAGVDVKRVQEATKVILEEFKKIKADGITLKELNRAKDNLKGRLYIGLEDSLSVAEFLAEQALLDKTIKSPEQIIKEIQAVDLKAVKNLSQEIFVNKNLNFTIIGPYDKKDDFDIQI
ncbi:MAG: insulinase family protein [Patescibacteria group bacterium]|nr:insulinase family protein [Patescibacteria group bacterium]